MARFTRFAVGTLLLTIAVAVAEPFSPRSVPTDARWVMHLDLAALKATDIGRMLLDESMQGDAVQQIESAKAMFRIDPREDLDAMTVYGSGSTADNAVVLLQGRFEQAPLVELVQTMEAYSVMPHGNHPIHSWIDPTQGNGTRSYGALVGARTLLVSQDMPSLQRALDVHDGSARNLSQVGGNALRTESLREDGVLLGITADLRDVDLSFNPMLSSFSTDTERFTLTLGESAVHGTTLALDVQRKTAEQASEMAQMMRGLLMMGAIQMQQENPATADLLQKVQITTAGNALQMRLRYPTDKLTALIRTSIEASTAVD